MSANKKVKRNKRITNNINRNIKIKQIIKNKLEQQKEQDNGWVATIVGQHAQAIFLVGILAFLSVNFPPEAIEHFNIIETLQDTGCIFVNLPHHIKGHPQVSTSFFPTPAFCHIITCVAFGDRVPEWFHPSDPNSFKCSHLCEAFWHEFFKTHPPVNDSVLPSIHCVNPFHLTIERHETNSKRGFCTKTWEGGCKCGQQLPCLFFSQAERELMKDLYQEWKHIFKINHLRGADVGDNFFLLTPEDFNMHGQYPTPGVPEDLEQAMQPMDVDREMMALLLDMTLEMVDNPDIPIKDAVDPFFAQFLHALVQEKETQARHNQPDAREAPHPEDREKV